MECTAEKKTRYAQLHKNLNEIIPKDIRKTLLELEDNPLWVDIGDHLKSIPLREKVDRMKLIDELSEKTKRDYYELRDALATLEKEGYVYVRKRSMHDHFLAPRFVEAMRIRREIETEVLNPLLKEMKDDPEFSDHKDLGKALKHALYAALLE